MDVGNPGSSIEQVEVLPDVSDNVTGWQPVLGAETLAVLDRLNIPDEGKYQIRNEALSIMSKCIPPRSSSTSVTGLVIGYVQSGKTMSFTTVAALARDNGYQLVIVIAGTSNNLLEQSTDRLKTDLQLDTRQERRWQLFETKSIGGAQGINALARSINNTLRDWRDPNVPESERRTILITAMKQYQHLDKLRKVLEKVSDIDSVPTLVIDDEADQRSLNTNASKRDNQASRTYESIVALKNSVPRHSFLQYTATPQAPLLINIIDTLSPRFVQVLTPGAGYVGGKTFFVDNPDLVETIPYQEIPTDDVSLLEPPDSLLLALKIYFLGVAAGLEVDNGRGNRSMLVHPSHKTIPHQQYYQWIDLIVKRWQETIDLANDEPDRVDLVSEFREAYTELSKTSEELSAFEVLFNRLPQAFRRTSIQEINSREGRTPSVDWTNEYGHILVGGQSMDRGFTIEGLTVTYMPRGKGLGNADTIQQRARFFGYKRRYLQFCRVFVDDAVRESFRNYVLHEEDIRNRLTEFGGTGQPLTEWRRAFFLSVNLKPCRDDVLDLDYIRGNFKQSWFTPKAPHDSSDAVVVNRALLMSFIQQLQLKEDDGHPKRTAEQRHWFVSNLSLASVYETLLVGFRVTRYEDSERYTGLLLQVSAALERNSSALCTFYQMSKGNLRERALDKTDEIANLFQGKNPMSGPVIYPGDRKIVADGQVTVQYHNLRLVGDSVRIENVPTLAIYIPEELSADWLVQSSRPKARSSRRRRNV